MCKTCFAFKQLSPFQKFIKVDCPCIVKAFKKYIIKILRDNDIFWELNTSGNYIYYYDFLTNEKKQQIIKESGIPVSVGSDTHYIAEYRKKQIRRANELLQKLNIPLP